MGTGCLKRGEIGDDILGNVKNLAFWAILLLLLVTLFSVFQDGGTTNSGSQRAFSYFLGIFGRREGEFLVE